MSLIKYILLNGRHLLSCYLGKIRAPTWKVPKHGRHDKLKPHSRLGPSSQFVIVPYNINAIKKQLIHECMLKPEFSKPSCDIPINCGRITVQNRTGNVEMSGVENVAHATLSTMLLTLNQSQQHLVGCALENSSYLLGELKAKPPLVKIQQKNVCRDKVGQALLQILQHSVNISTKDTRFRGTSLKKQPLKRTVVFSKVLYNICDM